MAPGTSITLDLIHVDQRKPSAQKTVSLVLDALPDGNAVDTP
jgi:hypothetical protein